MKKIVFVLLFLVAISSFAARDQKITQSQAILVELRDPVGDEPERFLRVKEVESGKITQLTLEKDAATPQVWSGYFAIQFLTGDASLRTLDFINAQGESFFASISQQKSLQKVVLFKTLDELTLFEMSSTEQAKLAEKSAERQIEKQIAKQIQVTRPKAGAAPGAKIDTGKIEQLVRQQGRLQETAQLSLEEAEAKQRQALLESKAKATAEQQAKDRAEATRIVTEADEAYAKRKYKEAGALYAKATGLDPGNDTYYYRYGVTLYKVGNYNKSIAVLSLAEVEASQAVEKDYYIALNHLKLKDYDKARKEFIEVREENSPELSPVASYFAGTIEFQQQKYPEARKSMEYVLDSSKDPKLDRSADSMLEQIDRMEAFYESQREKYRLTFTSGLVYDTNVLNAAENNVATDVKGWRLAYGATATAFLFRNPGSDLAAAFSFSDHYSVNSSFAGDANLQAADAMELGASLPYHQEFKVGQRALGLEVLPSYKNILMSPTGGSRTVAVRSTGVSTTLSSPLKSDLFLSGRLDLSQDEVLLSTSVDDNNLSGSRYGLTLIPMKLLDLKGEHVLVTEISYLTNNTAGKEYRSNRAALGAAYTFPTFYKGTASARVDYSLQDYFAATTPRKDTVFLFTGSYTKSLTKEWNWTLSVQWTNANSESDAYKYNKYFVSNLFTYSMSILQ